MDLARRDPAAIVRQIIGDAVLEPEDRGHIMEAAAAVSEALLADQTVTQAGLQASISFLNTSLRSYAAVQADRKRFADIAKVEVVKPWVVLGVPRGGTTFLHALLAQDPANRSPSTWETSYPSPPPTADTYENDPRIKLWIDESTSGNAGKFRDVSDKEVMKRHMVGASLPQECGVMMMPVMRDTHIWAMTRVVDYMTWYLSADLQPAYKFHRQWLQHMQWRMPRDRWVLKCPTHALNLPSLFGAYPDACIIQTHRSPAAALSSLASLIGNYRRSNCDPVDPQSLGMEMLLMVKAHTDRPMAFRRANPDRKIIDLSHRAIVSDPIGIARRIYAAFDAELTPSAEGRMKKFISDNPQGAHGEHQHHLEDFGVSEGLMREMLSEYYSSFADLL